MFSPLYTIGGGSVGGTPGTIDSSIVVVPDAAGRLALAPAHVGQMLYQEDVFGYFTATGAAPGDWAGQFFLGGGGLPGTLVLYSDTGFFGAINTASLAGSSQGYTLPATTGTVDITP